jgi:hypothetical protein
MVDLCNLFDHRLVHWPWARVRACSQESPLVCGVAVD